MKILTLLNGEECMVDDDDYAELSKYTWYTITTQNNVYAQRTEWLRESKTCKYVLMHRQILGLGDSIYEVADHLNRNGLDNRKCNIRIATPAQNSQRAVREYKDKSSKYIGVRRVKSSGMYNANIRIYGMKTHLGNYSDEKEAARAYNEAALKHYGPHAKINEGV